MVRGEEEGGAEALDLQRSRRLDPEAVPDAVRGEHEERHPRRGDDREQQPAADERLTPPEAPPDVDERQRHEHGRVELRGDGSTEREVPEPEPPAEERSESCGGQRGRPEVEPREHDRPQRDDGERGEPENGEHPAPPCTERDERNRQADHDHLAEERHLELEPAAKRVPVGAAERGQREHGQRARWIFEREVPVRHLPRVDRRAVALVDGRVDDPVVREEPAVEHAPADQEQRARDERRREGEARLSRPGRAHAQRRHAPEPSPRAGGGRPARRRPRRGRTTGCRGRTSASASARSRSAPRR